MPIPSGKAGIANLPLHGGKAPAWLFQRMTKLAREITISVVSEYGPETMLRRLSEPFWFQALGCVLGFDWHSSGVTTTVCGALIEGTRELQSELGLFIAGGKGRASRKTPTEIEQAGLRLNTGTESLVYASRMAAKVDNTALQDGYQLYHHVFFFTKKGSWAIVQQGMNETTKYARRYHWLSEITDDFVCEPHAAICTEKTGQVLNLVARESAIARETIPAIIREDKPEKLVEKIKQLQILDLPSRHHIELQDIHPDRLYKTFINTYDKQPDNFEKLLGLEGVGPKTMRALALLAELVYDVPVSVRDPARYSFAHGGKDGHPFPVDKKTYDKSIELLHLALERARIGDFDKIEAFKRLKNWSI